MKTFFLTVILLMATCYCIAQNKPKKDDNLSQSRLKNKEFISWVEGKIDSVVQKNKIPAISVGIIKDSLTIFSKGFGLHNLNGTLKTSEFSIYQIASDTKKITGVISNNLADEKKLKLDEPIMNYVGSSIKPEAKNKLSKITLRHLLLHKSGLPYRQLTMKRKDGEPMLIPYTEQDLLNDLNNVELKHKPGEEFGYSNFGYAVAGYVCEKVSGKTYGELIDKYISRTYNMPNTVISLTNSQRKILVTPYKRENRTSATKAFTMGKLSAAGGVYSNISDLLTLMHQQIIAYTTFNKNQKSNPLVLHENPYEKEVSYGFGLGGKKFETGTQFGHGGDLDGFASGYVFSPEYKSGVIILTSSGGKWVGQLEKEIFYKLTERKYYPAKKSNP